jgi:hypothetical protein
VSSVSQPLQAVGDLFCSIYDALDDDAVAANGDRWLESRSLNSLSEVVMSDVLAGKTAGAIGTRINSGDDIDARHFAGLRGIDRAMQQLNPRTRRSDQRTPASLQALESHLARYRRLDSGVHGGALLLRLVHPGRREIRRTSGTCSPI